MPASAVRIFSDIDEYASAIYPGRAELTLTKSGDFNGKQTRVSLPCLWMQRFVDNLPWTGHAVPPRGRATIQFVTEPGSRLYVSGLEILPISVLAHAVADDFHGRAPEPTSHAFMSLPVEDLAEIGGTLAGGNLKPPLDASLITPAPSAMVKLQRLHAAAGYLAENAPEIIANPDAARGLQHALIEAMIGVLVHREDHQNSLARGQHAIIIRRFRKVIEENPEQPLYIAEICKAMRVSSRTLSTVCQEHLGMAPKRYLVLRRLNFVRRALREATPETTTVTDIATKYGFWQLGRFSTEYQSLFGESPSATLRRQPG